jgi:aminoglycoside phosphotransferase (APT) family kinase protein
MTMADIDGPALRAWLASAIGSLPADVSIEKFAGGQSNPTYRIAGEGVRAVLRRKPFGELLASAHAVEREFRLISALHPQGFPVPQPVALCEDVSVIGATFYVMQLVDGRNFQDGTLPGVAPHLRREVYGSMMRTLAQLHALDPERIGLTDFGRPGNYFERQVGRWTKQYRASQTEDVVEIERLIEWLPRTVPRQERISVIHGDYRIDNLIFDGSDVAAVLDWELATLGDPMADLSYAAMNWIMPANGNSGLAGADLEALALPTMDEAVSIYEDELGISAPRDMSWHFAFNLFRLCGIIQGIKKRALDGNASNAHARATSELLVPYARIAWEQARRAGAS